MREAVEHAHPGREPGDGAAVVLLVEEEAGLLPCGEVHRVLHAVFGDDGARIARVRQALVPAGNRLQTLLGAKRRLAALVYPAYRDAHVRKLRGERGVERVLALFHAVGHYLRDQHVLKPVHRHAGQAVGLAEDEAAGVEVAAHHRAAVLQRVLDAAGEKRLVIAVVGVLAEHAHGYLAAGAVYARAEPRALLREHVGYAAGRKLAGGAAYLLGVDPGVPSAQRALGLGADSDAGVSSA